MTSGWQVTVTNKASRKLETHFFSLVSELRYFLNTLCSASEPYFTITRAYQLKPGEILNEDDTHQILSLNVKGYHVIR